MEEERRNRGVGGQGGGGGGVKTKKEMARNESFSLRFQTILCHGDFNGTCKQSKSFTSFNMLLVVFFYLLPSLTVKCRDVFAKIERFCYVRLAFRYLMSF